VFTVTWQTALRSGSIDKIQLLPSPPPPPATTDSVLNPGRPPRRDQVKYLDISRPASLPVPLTLQQTAAQSSASPRLEDLAQPAPLSPAVLLCLVPSYHHLVAQRTIIASTFWRNSHHPTLLLCPTKMGKPTETSRSNGNGSSEELARIAIDRGGTFTDAICSRAGKEDIVVKVSKTRTYDHEQTSLLQTRPKRGVQALTVTLHCGGADAVLSCSRSIRRTTRMPRQKRECRRHFAQHTFFSAPLSSLSAQLRGFHHQHLPSQSMPAHITPH
jgi:hypothetical protein